MSSDESESERMKMKSVVKVACGSFQKINAESESDEENGSERDWRKRTDHNSSINEEDNDEHYQCANEEGSSLKKQRKFSPDRDESYKRKSSRRSDTEEWGEKNDDQKKNKRSLRKRRTEGDKPTTETEESDKTEPFIKKPRDNKKTIEDIFTKAGGAYIPPSKLRALQANITDKTSTAYQRMSWEALKKSINGLVNKVNISNIGFIVQEILQENIIRGRGILCQSITRAQVASPTFTHVYAALVSIINTKFPKIGELLIRRLIMQFKKAFKRNDKAVCISSVKFLAHLVNQEVVHELLALEVLTLLLQNPSGDSCEVAISFLKEVGQKLTEISPRGINAIFETLRDILHRSDTEKRVQYMMEVMFAIRKDGFKEHPIRVEGLDLVEENDQVTHLIRMGEKGNTEDLLNVFKVDPNFEENEEKYKQIKSDLLGSDDSSDEDGSDDESGSDEDDEEDFEEAAAKKAEEMEIIDKTETNLVALRRLIYLTIQSSLDYEECAHKMMKLNIKPGQEHEFCLMVLECCSQQRSYEKFFGLLGQRFCLLKKEFMEQYMVIFNEQYENCHQLETNRLRNTAKFFAHLLHCDAMPWTVLATIFLNEDDTTSSSRIFIKVIFQDLAEYLGMKKLKLRINDPIISSYVEGVFPRDNPRNTRFSINFFTAIGLGGLTDELRAHLKTMPKMIPQQQQEQQEDDDSDSSSSSSSDSSSSSSSSSSDEDSADERKRTKKKDQMKRRDRDGDRNKGSERSDRREPRRRKEDSPVRRSRDEEREPIERSKRHGSNDRSRRRESPDRVKRRDSPDRSNRRDSPDRSNRRDSPDRSNRRDSPDRSNRRDSPDRSNRRESPYHSKRRDSPDREKRRDSPKRRESPSRTERRKSPDHRSKRRESPGGRDERGSSPHNGHLRKTSPSREVNRKHRDQHKSDRSYQKYSSRHSNRSVSRER